MKINEIITEAFDKPYAFKWQRGDHGDYDILVKLPDGSPLSITFNHEGDNEWHVAFDRGHSQDITGEGDAQRIFATVLTSIQKFIKKHKPQQLTFSAIKDVEPNQNSESRAKLYNRLVDRYATSWGYDALINDLGDQVEYELTRLQPVTEDSNNGKPSWYINSYDNFETAFEIDLVVDGKDIGFFSYQYDPEQDTVENDVRIINDSEKGHGYGKLLLLKAIETAQQHNLPYKRDHRGTSPAQSRVYSSLVDDGIIKIGYDKTITLTGKNLSTTKKKQPKFSLIAHGEYAGHFDDYEDAVREADRIANDPNSKYQMVMVKDNSSKEIVYEVWRGKDLNEEEFNGIDIDMDIEGDEIMVTAMANGRELGHVLFVDEGEYLMPQDLEVDERFQGQGIAAAMYDYVKSKGYKIRRSGQQTDAGAGFWGKHRPEQNVWESESSDSVLFLGPDAVIVGQEHGKPLKLSDQEQQKIRDIAERHGAWYEGNGMDQKHTKDIIDDYRGSWDDDLLSPKIKGYPAPFLYVLFSNIKENDTVDGKIGFDPKSTIFDRILDTQPSANYFPDRKFDAETLQKFLKSVSEGQYDFVRMSQAPATEQNVRKFFTQGERLMFPDNWEEYPYRAGRVAKSVNDLRDKFLASRKRGVYVAGSDHLRAVQQFLDQNKQGVAEGKHPNQQVVNAIQKVLPVAQEIWFHGSRATGQHRRNSDTDILVVVPDDLVGDQYLGVVRILQKLSSHFDNYDIQPTKSGTNIHQIAQEEGKLLWSTTNENFADGKVKGKSRPGRVKRAGASCSGSVTDLRARARNASGEKAKMYHWCANMKSGRKK